jgi:chitinase
MSESEQNGFATATSAYLVLADTGGNIGGTRKGALQMEADQNVKPLCFDRKFASLEEIDAAVPPVSATCAYLYSMPIFTKMVEDTLEDFKWVSNGYDNVWKYYEDEARNMVQGQLSKFMDDKTGKGLKYFMCTQEGGVPTRCDNIGARLWDSNNELYEWIDDTAEKKFYAELLEETGLPKEGIYWSSKTPKYPKQYAPSGKNGTAEPLSEIRKFKNGFPSIEYDYPIANPKDILTTAAKGMEAMTETYYITYLSMLAGVWDGDHGDIFDTYSVSAFMIVQALENMEQAKKIGKKAKDNETKNIVMAVLNTVFLLIPFAGGAGTSLTGLTALGRAGGLIGISGSTTLGVYEAFENPKMAPMAILGILLGVRGFQGAARGGAMTEKDVADMVALRAGITPKMAKGLGTSFEKNDNLRKKIGSSCYGRKM